MLGPGLSLDPCFFANHSQHADKERFWKQSTHWSWNSQSDIGIAASSQFAHIDGMFEYHDLERGTSELTSNPNIFPRDCFKQDSYPIQSNTRISYCRVNSYLCKYKCHISGAELIQMSDLFLVDAPLALRDCSKRKDSRARTTLRVRYTNSRGGLVLPQLFSQHSYSLLESFKSLFQHSCHLALIFSGISGVLPPHAMMHRLSSSLWETNIRLLNSDIK